MTRQYETESERERTHNTTDTKEEKQLMETRKKKTNRSTDIRPERQKHRELHPLPLNPFPAQQSSHPPITSFHMSPHRKKTSSKETPEACKTFHLLENPISHP
ncbi:hypothetical protein CPC08DRAFT_119821 [Agrocybe pediades]|nr:hypothetical protein CPC08DRAFT_119821 [Agrocybe pediades]